MSRRLVLAGAAAIGLALGCRTTTNASASSDAAQLLATDREWAKLSSTSQNADSITGYWTDDARVVLPGLPVVSGKTAIRAMVAGMEKIAGFRISWTPDSAAVSRSGDLGYTYGTSELHSDARDGRGEVAIRRRGAHRSS